MYAKWIPSIEIPLLGTGYWNDSLPGPKGRTSINLATLVNRSIVYSLVCYEDIFDCFPDDQQVKVDEQEKAFGERIHKMEVESKQAKMKAAGLDIIVPGEIAGMSKTKTETTDDGKTKTMIQTTVRDTGKTKSSDITIMSKTEGERCCSLCTACRLAVKCLVFNIHETHNNCDTPVYNTWNATRVIQHLLQRQLLRLWYLRQQRVRVRVMIGFLVRDRVRIKIMIRVRVRVRVGVTFNVGVYRWSNCRRSKCRTFATSTDYH